MSIFVGTEPKKKNKSKKICCSLEFAPSNQPSESEPKKNTDKCLLLFEKEKKILIDWAKEKIYCAEEKTHSHIKSGRTF